MLEKIFKKYGIILRNSVGTYRMMVDVIEDMYLKLGNSELKMLFFEISEDEKYANVFDDARGRSYKGVE